MARLHGKVLPRNTQHMATFLTLRLFKFLQIILNKNLSCFFSESQHAIEKSISGDKLRLWHPMLGTPLVDHNVDNVVVTKSSSSSHGSSSHSSSSTQFPCTLERKGRYGYSVEWADGATVIYSYATKSRWSVCFDGTNRKSI